MAKIKSVGTYNQYGARRSDIQWRPVNRWRAPAHQKSKWSRGQLAGMWLTLNKYLLKNEVILRIWSAQHQHMGTDELW